ncbi:MAG: hypothetical protein IPM42_15610 [Saprospiraceae bacterium]|nr:hypothetical protein [Saprospiraceae bacterium]
MKTESERIDSEIIINSENRKQIYYIIQLSIGTEFLYFFIEYIRPCLPENLIVWNGTQIKLIGLIIICIVIFNSILITNYINKIKPNLSIFKIVGLSGFFILLIELIFKVTQNIFVLHNGLNFDVIEILIPVLIISIFGMLISNIRAHKIRNQKTFFPIIILISFWTIIGLIIQNTSQ